MSQNWHGHWVEENYKSTRLGNWEVPKWYPQWPDRHCRTTTFQCDDKGHLLVHLKKNNHGRENFKTAWELPKKIDRRLAQELSAPPEYKKQLWKAHKAFHRAACGESPKKELKPEKKIKSENILTGRSFDQKEKKSEPVELPKPNPEAKAKLTQQSPVLDMKAESKNSIEKSDSIQVDTELKVLESESVSDPEDNVNKAGCFLHQTCKI